MWLWCAVAWSGEPIRLFLQDPGDKPRLTCDTEMAKELVGLLDRATASIDFAIYGYRRQEAVVRALRDARDRGVVVRGVVDLDAQGGNPYAETNALIAEFGLRTDRAFDQATAAKPSFSGPYRCPSLPGRSGPPQCVSLDLGQQCLFGTLQSVGPFEEIGGIMHNKFFVIDEQIVWTGSANISDTCTGGYNANAVVVVQDPVVAAFYRAEFQQMWDGRFHEAKVRQGGLKVVALPDGGSIQTWFSPEDDPMDAVRAVVQRSARRVDIAVFFLTHSALVRDLLAAHARGVAVRVLIDATGASNEYSKHDVLRAAGIPVKVENWGGKMHAKVAAVDGEVVVIGSMNWTVAGASTNDENTLLLYDKGTASTVEAWIDRLWNSVPDRWLVGRPDPESADSVGSCVDGSDNDFDNLRDADDPGCGANPPAVDAPYVFDVRPKEAGQQLVRAFEDARLGRVYAEPGSAAYDLGGDSVWFCSGVDAAAAGYARYERAGAR